MTNRLGGSRRKTRHKLKKETRQKSKISLKRYLQNIKVGEKVKLITEPSIAKSIYHQRYYGLRGVVKGKRGECYEVLIKHMGKEKTLLIHPVHLRTQR